jgi:RimJ/RimL family protein N-acetyltransferase
MISELVDNYRVRRIFAVLKRKNFRSMRLLERLGFVLAASEERATHNVEPGEVLMRREGACT